MGSQQASVQRNYHSCASPGGRDPRQGDVQRDVPHRHLHPRRTRSRGSVPVHPGPRGRRSGGERGCGGDLGGARGPRRPVLHPAVQWPQLHLLRLAQDEPVPCHPLHPGRRGDARRHLALLHSGRQAHLPLHGLFHVLRVHRHRRDFRGENQPAYAPQQGVPLRVRSSHGPRCGLEHVQGGGWVQRRRLWAGRGGPSRGAGGQDGGRVSHYLYRP
mmetsp:Transcript_4650/g.11491  ORF Transcript_4650/g.11491 Transcript_4650/m.11491 type:complete len:215 (-) Transcript_4650:606-1250(-)